MKNEREKIIAEQKKKSRAYKGTIVALVALIGFLKISIGGFINVPIALIFGDIFVGFFGLLIIYALYLFLFRATYRKRRVFAFFSSLLGLLLVASGVYALIIHEFGNDGTTFKDNLEAMVTLARQTISFESMNTSYWYRYAGLIGEGYLYLVSDLGRGLMIAVLAVIGTLFFVILFWPLLVKFAKFIKEKKRELKKRRRVLLQAGIINEEVVKDGPTQVSIEEVIQDTNKTKENPLLKRVGDDVKVETISVLPSKTQQPLKKEEKPLEVIEEELFELPTLDSEEKIEAIHQEIKNDSLTRVSENFDSLQKAVDTTGSIESIAFKPEEAIELEKELIDEIPSNDVRLDSMVTPEPRFNESEKNEFELPKMTTSFIDKYVNFRLPNINLLDDVKDDGKIEENRIVAAEYEHKINAFFHDFEIGARVAGWTIGSTFTRFEILLDANESVKKITPNMQDISRRLHGSAVRFEPIIPGKNTSGLEVENRHRTNVSFKECMQNVIETRRKDFTIPFGKDVAGNVIKLAFADFPHLLVAGSTNSGKSVFLHTVLTSLIMQHSPNDLRLLLIDPKRVELAQYEEIPHLIAPPIKEPREAKVALERLIDEMERRYKLFEKTRVSKISDYNDIVEEIGGEKIPTIIAILDEFADLFESEKEVSTLVLRLVQKSRAAGIHLLIATQRPSVQVITGNIKANITSRVAFMTASAIDSTTILGQGGAELLLGLGDMLLDCVATGQRGLVRVQAPYISIKEVQRVTNFLRTNYATDYLDKFLDLEEKVTYQNGMNNSYDELYPSVLEFTLQNDSISISRIQIQFSVGWPRARQLYEMLLQNGIIEAPDEQNSAKGAVVVANKRR